MCVCGWAALLSISSLKGNSVTQIPSEFWLCLPLHPESPLHSAGRWGKSMEDGTLEDFVGCDSKRQTLLQSIIHGTEFGHKITPSW